jgi:glycosyltransferase involved in cell wall biosynthesis
MPRVSVIVPTYNRRDCLVDTLRTALNQSYRDFELLVVDDGSTDESAVEVLRQLGPDPQRAESIWRQHTASSSGACGFSFWRNDILVQYIFQANRGIGAARNRGLQAVHGEYVAFLEPEYAWDPHHLESHMEFLEECGEAWAAHGRVTQGRSVQKGTKKKPRSGPTPIPFEEVVAGNDLHTSAMVIRRRCLLAHGCFDENIPACEDYDLWVRIAAHVPIHHIPESVVHVKQPPAISSWNLDRYRVYALEKAFQSGHLNAEQRHRVAEEMVNRCDILVEGYRKRNNTERANFYDRKRRKFEMEVAKLDLSSVAIRPDEYNLPARIRDEEGSLSGRV